MYHYSLKLILNLQCIFHACGIFQFVPYQVSYSTRSWLAKLVVCQLGQDISVV